MMFLLVVAAVVSLGSAARPCSSPHELSFRASRWNYGETYYERMFAEYDRRFERVVFFVESQSGKTKEMNEYLFLHDIHKGYDYNFQSKKCKEFHIGRFVPIEVPPHANFDGEYELGGPHASVFVDVWNDRVKTKRENWIGEFSKKTCYPIRTFLIDEGDFNKTVNTFVYDTVEGILNPNDFEVPEACKEAEKVDFIPTKANEYMSQYTRTLYN